MRQTNKPLDRVNPGTFSIHLSEAVRKIRPEASALADKRYKTFSNVPIRRSDILQLQGPRASLLLPYSLGPHDGVFRVMVLTEQLSPPRALMTGNYQWSVLRFVVCAVDHNQGHPASLFDVKIPDIDVGRQGPFLAVYINSMHTSVACFSCRHSQVVIFQVPDIAQASEPVVASTLQLPFSDVITVARWHHTFPTILVVTTGNLIVVIDTLRFSGASSLRAVCVSDVVDIVLLPTSPMPNQQPSVTPIPVLALKRDGSVQLIVVPPVSSNKLSATSSGLDDDGTIRIGALPSAATLNNQEKLVSSRSSRRRQGPGCQRPLSRLSYDTDPLSHTSAAAVVDVLPAGSHDSSYASLSILRHELLFIVCRITEGGHLEIHGIDTALDSLERRLLSDKILESFASTSLDEMDVPVSLGSVPVLHVSPTATMKREGASFFPCPFLTIFTPAELVVVEFPWLTQVEAFSTSLMAPPSLVPSNIQSILSLENVDRATEDDEDLLYLGVLVAPSEAVDPAPRTFLLKTQIESSDYPAVGSPAWSAAGNKGWDICDNWDLLAVSLSGRLTTNGMLQRYRTVLADAWDNLSADSQSVSPLPNSQKREVARELSCRTTVESLRAAFRKLRLLPSDATAQDKRFFTFTVSYQEPVKDVLAKLGVSSLKLWKFCSFQAQLKQIQKEIDALKAFDNLEEVEDTNRKLQTQAEHLCRRIEKIKETHTTLTHSLRTLLTTHIIPLADAQRLGVIEQQVIPLLRHISLPATALLATVIRAHSDGITSAITEQLLLESVSRGTHTKTSPQAAAETELLRRKVEQLIWELADTSHECLALAEETAVVSPASL